MGAETSFERKMMNKGDNVIISRDGGNRGFDDRGGTAGETRLLSSQSEMPWSNSITIRNVPKT